MLNLHIILFFLVYNINFEIYLPVKVKFVFKQLTLFILLGTLFYIGKCLFCFLKNISFLRKNFSRNSSSHMTKKFFSSFFTST